MSSRDQARSALGTLGSMEGSGASHSRRTLQDFAIIWQLHPGQLPGRGVRSAGRRKTFFREAATRDADQVRAIGRMPVERRSALLAKVALLVVVLLCMTEGIDRQIALGLAQVGAQEVVRHAEGAAGSPFAVRAVADATDLWGARQCNKGSSAGAARDSIHR